MKVNICFIPESFDFSRDQVSLALSIKASSEMINKYFEDDGFISFSKSKDFDCIAATEIFKQPSHLEGGIMMSLLYDANMGKANSLANLNSEQVKDLVDLDIPELDGAWLSLYRFSKLAKHKERNITDDHSLVKFGSDVLINNPRSYNDYAESFVQLYKNLIFLDYPSHKDYQTFNSIRKTEGGYQSFIKGITDCLCFMDQYQIVLNDSQNNIRNINAALDFSVTPEGGGKNKRAIAALKRDFLINGITYKNVNCEYHYKLEHVDGANGKGTYYFNRIYFGFFNKINPNKPQIAVAHIGEHL